jgi:hypothetical protein
MPKFVDADLSRYFDDDLTSRCGAENRRTPAPALFVEADSELVFLAQNYPQLAHAEFTELGSHVTLRSA